jgi:3-hydroxyacyl-CoA dehydrogenase/enoyl-CoA hydratase/carnithine racemase
MNDNHYRNFTVTTDDRSVRTVTLDVPGRPLNVLNRDVMEELDQIVHDLENGDSDSVKLVIFQSGKESGFLAGADVMSLSNIESAVEATQIIEKGQTLFQRIEWLSMPTIAVIHGPCLGGGLELSLACNFRIARDNSSTKIGVPEIKLGLIPGWGGTQRLPRVAGLTNALSMILTGKHLSGSQAAKIGLVDRAISPDDWESGIADFIDGALGGNLPAREKRPFGQRFMEATGIGRSIIYRMTEKSIASKVKHYPALAAALRAVRLAFRKRPDGYLCERNEFVDLLATSTCRNLLDLFFAREQARTLATWSPEADQSVHQSPIRTVGVIGAGAMGAGIGQLAAVRGFNVVIKEIDEKAAAAGQKRIEALVDDLARRKRWTSDERQNLLNKIDVGCDDQALTDCDLVIEAAVEREDIKHQIFGTLDKVVQGSAILASNTSALSVSRMAEATGRSAQVAGLHFFNPVHRMELVEVVRAVQSDDATIARLVAFVKALGKTPIVTADSPGFLVNRVLFPYLGEAVLMVAEGYDVAQMDKEVRRFGMPMGPLELLDQVGLDVGLHVASSLNDILPGVAPVVELLAAMVENGNLGKKQKLGFYQYKKGKRAGVARLPFVDTRLEPAELKPNYLDDGLTPIQRRLVYPMLAEAVRCHEEGIVWEPWAIDLGMVLGTGFAPHRGGPLHVVDGIGLHQVTENLSRLRDELGDRFAPPKELIEMSNVGDSFFDRGDTTQQQIASSS